MAFQFRERGRGRVEHRAPFALFGRHRLEVGPVEDARMHDRFAGGLRERDARDGDGNGNCGDDEISSGDHPRISAGKRNEVKRTNYRRVTSTGDCVPEIILRVSANAVRLHEIFRRR